MQRATRIRAAIEAREAYLMKKAATAQARLQAADKAYQEGDIRVAARIYVSLAQSRSGDTASLQARQHLDQLAAEATEKRKQIEADFAKEQAGLSPGELSPSQFSYRWSESVLALLQKYDELTEKYDAVPAAKRELGKQIAKQRNRPEYAAVLKEPEAKALWDLGQQHEQQDSACCAYWVYKHAAQLTPAPSARRAHDRLAKMEQDPKTIEAAKACRDLQECHKIYNSAVRIVDTNPDRARQLLLQVVDRAPKDSTLYVAAQQRITGPQP